MALSYAPINTTPENLGDNNLFYIDAYDVPGRGALVRTYIEKPFSIQVPRETLPVTFKTEQINPIISERALTLPHVSVSDLSALVVDGSVPWTTLSTEILPRGQARVTRSVTVPDKGSLVHVYTETSYRENNKPKLTMSFESLYWTDGAVVSGTDLVAGGSVASPHYGEIWTNGNGSATSLSGMSTWAKFSCFSQNGQSSGAVPDYATDTIAVSRNGEYFVSVSASVFGGASATYELGVKKNMGAISFSNLNAEKQLDASGGVSSVSVSGIASFLASDRIEFWVQQTSGSLVNPTIRHATLSISEVGR